MAFLASAALVAFEAFPASEAFLASGAFLAFEAFVASGAFLAFGEFLAFEAFLAYSLATHKLGIVEGTGHFGSFLSSLHRVEQ